MFDLGGGTLDVSLLETKDGWLRVVDHAGDNFLGGKDFDNALVDWAVERLRKERPLRDLGRSNPQTRRAVGKLKAACESAKIDLSRADSARIVVPELTDDDQGQPVEVDIEITRTAFEALVAPLVDRGLELCREGDRGLRATGPAGMVETVLDAVLDNAVKFTPAGGRVVVTTRARAERVEIAVQDTGPGLRPDELDRALDRFWRSPGQINTEGSGLGLAIAARTVEVAGGELALELPDGGGLRVVARLPRP